MNEKTFKCYGCMSEKPLSEKSNHFVRVICIETKEITFEPVCKSCRDKFLKMDGEQDMNMSEDITFCDDSDTCKNKSCFRHKCHIKHFEIPHSYAHMKGTNECERKDVWHDGND